MMHSMFTMAKIGIQTTLIFLIPSAVSAQQTVRTIAGTFIDILNQMSLFIMALALLAFIFGAVRFIATAGDDQARESGKQLMIWGIASLFVMIAVWGLVAILQNTFFGQ